MHILNFYNIYIYLDTLIHTEINKTILSINNSLIIQV